MTELAPDAGPDGRGGVAVAIRKRIPVAGGLAGGSADAAAALVACNALWQAELSQQELCEVAGRVGSDVAFAVLGGTAVGRGRGEQLTPALVAPAALPLGAGVRRRAPVHPGRVRDARPAPRREDVSEPELERGADGGAPGRGRRRGSERRSATTCRPPRSRCSPRCARPSAAGREFGALGSLVSGSGPTCFFLARDERHATDLAVALSGAGVCRSVAKATGAVPGASLVAR